MTKTEKETWDAMHSNHRAWFRAFYQMRFDKNHRNAAKKELGKLKELRQILKLK